MPDSDCIFHSLASLRAVPLFLSSSSFSTPSRISLHFWHRYLRATHPRGHGTPVRKRGVRNVIAPLREVSWYATPPPSYPATGFHLGLSPADVHPEEALDRVYYAPGLWHISRVLSSRFCIKCYHRNITVLSSFSAPHAHVIFMNRTIVLVNCWTTLTEDWIFSERIIHTNWFSATFVTQKLIVN